MIYPNFMWKLGGAGTTVKSYIGNVLYEHTFKEEVSKEFIEKHLADVKQNIEG